MTITVDLPEDICTHPEAGREALEVLAVNGYRTEAFTKRQAAALLGISWYDFDGLLKSLNVSEGSYDVEEFRADLATLDELRLGSAVNR